MAMVYNGTDKIRIGRGIGLVFLVCRGFAEAFFHDNVEVRDS